MRHLPYTTYTTPLSISLFGMASLVFSPLAVADNINNGDEPIAFALVESSDELSINTATNTSATTEDEVNDDGVMVTQPNPIPESDADTYITADVVTDVANGVSNETKIPKPTTQLPALDTASPNDNSAKTTNSEQKIAELSQYYLPKPADDGASSSNVIQAQDLAPDLVPVVPVFDAYLDEAFEEQLEEYSDMVNAPRCEGVWVAPNPLVDEYGQPSNYQNALNEAKARGELTDAQLANGLPLYAVADYAYYDNEDYVELAGNVEVVQNGQVMRSEAMTLDIARNLIGASGNVMLANSNPSALSNTDNNAKTINPNDNALTSGVSTTLQSTLSPQANLQTNSNLQTTGVDLETVASSNNPSPSKADAGLIVLAGDVAYDGTRSASTAHDVAFASTALQAHGYAERLNMPSNERYEMDKVIFSTCPPTDRKWQLESDALDLNTQTGRGEAYDATFRLGDVPVFYLPYFNFPIDDRRTSGLLTPSVQIDTQSGLQVSVPYYLNLAPQIDATVTADAFTNRNPMLTGELRYLTDGYGQGSATATYLPNDRQYNDQTRRGFFYAHEWQPESIDHLKFNAVYNYVSDPDYLSDFDTFGLTDNPLNLPRRAEVNYYNDYVDANLKVETFQSLDAVDADGNEILDKDKPYSRLPELSIDYRLPWQDYVQFDKQNGKNGLNDDTSGNTLSNSFVNGLNHALNNVMVTGKHDSAYFKKSIGDGSENEKSGVRIYNRLTASYPVVKPWGYVTPEASIGHLFTAYDEASRLDNAISEEDNTKSVFVPKVSVDAGLNFYQAGSPFDYFDTSLGGYQLLSPRLKYTYAPYRSQADLPNFNTRIASVSYDQLFADDWFLGYDRLPDANNLTAGLNYRYIDAMGVTRFDASLGNQLYLEDTRVTLDGRRVFTDDTSGFAWQTSTQPYRNVWFDFNGALNSDNDLNFAGVQFRYQPTPKSLFNVGAIERKTDANTGQSELSALTASAIVPISSRWRVMAQGQYDVNNDRMVDATVGADFEDCCYGLSLYARRYYNDLDLDNKPNEAIMLEFRINGLGDASSRFSQLLNNKILGFEPVNRLWKE